jgi:hypothetical protein
MVSAQSDRDLRALLTGTKSRRLIEDMARAMLAREDALEYSNRLLEQFIERFYR